jgi:hypothetical protein
MFNEIALTPQVFDQASNPDVDKWLDYLYELGRGLDSRTTASPIITADLYDGTWSEVARRMLSGINDSRIRDRVQRILTRIRHLAVPRPAELESWPDNEQAWASEVIASHRAEPFSRILLTDLLDSSFDKQSTPCYSLHDLTDNTFWEGIQSQQSVPMEIQTQVDLLRPLCVHAHFISLKMPYARGCSDDETIFLCELIKSAFDRPQGFSSVEIDLHVDSSIGGKPSSNDYQNNLFHNLKCCFNSYLLSGSRFNCFLWPHFTDRLLVAGFIKDGKRYPRWGVSFSHIARPRDNISNTSWSLIDPRTLAEYYEQVDPNSPDILQHQTFAF